MKLKYMKLMIINYLLLLLLEFSFKILVLKTFDMGFLYILLFSMPISIFLTIITHLFKKEIINKVISVVVWLAVLFIFCAETVYYSFYKTICGFSAIIYGGQVMDFLSSIIAHIEDNIHIIILFIIPIVGLLIFSILKSDYKKYLKKESYLLLVSSIFLVLTGLELNFREQDNAKKLFYSTNDLMQSTNKFGVLSAVSLDAVKLLSNFEEEILNIKELEFTKDDKKEYNLTDINFDELIENTNDKTLKDMHTYFKNMEPTNQNEYTGLFAGKNLIFIVAEGFYPIAVDKKVTPTLYKLVNNGFIFTNYYQPIYNCSTSDGEFINQLSILPGVATCSMKETTNVYLPYNVGNIFKDYGYKTYAFHGWTYNYYGRDKTVPNLGYKYYGYDRFNTGYKNALKGINYSWPTSDIEVVKSSYNYYHKEDRFVAYYMSISGHLNYNFTGGNAMALKNKNAVKSIKANDSVKAYIATQVEFDRSLKLLLEKLESDGILDDTVIVISADHYPYGLTNKEISSYVDWMKNPNFDLYKNNLVIYNTQLQNTVVDKYTSSLDLLPTILNLFGIKYDSRLLIGRDIFSTSDDLIIFNNKSWITKKGRYDYLKQKFEPFTDEELESDYVDEINAIVNLKFQMSKLLISKDYYRKTLGG